jgi:hypothetical protein
LLACCSDLGAATRAQSPSRRTEPRSVILPACTRKARGCCRPLPAAMERSQVCVSILLCALSPVDPKQAFTWAIGLGGSIWD